MLIVGIATIAISIGILVFLAITIIIGLVTIFLVMVVLLVIVTTITAVLVVTITIFVAIPWSFVAKPVVAIVVAIGTRCFGKFDAIFIICRLGKCILELLLCPKTWMLEFLCRIRLFLG